MRCDDDGADADDNDDHVRTTTTTITTTTLMIITNKDTYFGNLAPLIETNTATTASSCSVRSVLFKMHSHRFH